MTKKVVLFNIDTNEYLNYPETTKEWVNAKTFDSEDLALGFLKYNSLIAKEKGLTTWCTRTFYEL